MKTKQQKQAEAIQRKRASLPRLRQAWTTIAPGTDGYRANCDLYGEEYADQLARNRRAKLERAAREAGCDAHGNELS